MLKTVNALNVSEKDVITVDVVAILEETETDPVVNVGGETVDNDDWTTDAVENVAVADEKDTELEVNGSGAVVVV